MSTRRSASLRMTSTRPCTPAAAWCPSCWASADEAAARAASPRARLFALRITALLRIVDRRGSGTTSVGARALRAGEPGEHPAHVGERPLHPRKRVVGVDLVLQ